MDSSKVPATVQQNSDKIVCDICDMVFNSQISLNFHFRERSHILRARDLSQSLFGYLPDKRITCLNDIFYNPQKKGSFIGMHYLRNYTGKRLYFSCRLCDAACTTIYQHLLSIKHRKKYISREFSFLFKDVECLSPQTIEKIAVAIEKVEGLQKFKYAVKNQTLKTLPERFSASDSSASRQILDKLVELLQIDGIALPPPYGQGNAVPYLATVSHASGTNERKIINPSVLSKPSATSKTTSRQVDDKTDKRQIHGIDFTDTRSHASTINEKSIKRPLRFKPLAAFKRRKSELAHQHTGEDRSSLSRPVSVPVSVSYPSVGVPVGNNLYGHNSLQSTKLPTTINISPMNDGMAQKPIPSLCSSNPERWFYQQTGVRYPSRPPSVSFYQTAEHGSSYSDQSRYGFANKTAEHGYSYYSDQSLYGSAYGQTGSVSAFGAQTWGQETGHPGAQHLHQLGMMGGSVSSLNGPTSVASLKQDTTSCYGYISVDSKELFSKSSTPSGIISVVKNEPSLLKSLGDIRAPEGLPSTTSTSSRAQTSQSTNSDMPAKAASILSPHTLKILQGRDPESVKSILKRLSEYCPELQQVNIALLVDVLFETGALR